MPGVARTQGAAVCDLRFNSQGTEGHSGRQGLGAKAREARNGAGRRYTGSRTAKVMCGGADDALARLARAGSTEGDLPRARRAGTGLNRPGFRHSEGPEPDTFEPSMSNRRNVSVRAAMLPRGRIRCVNVSAPLAAEAPGFGWVQAALHGRMTTASLKGELVSGVKHTVPCLAELRTRYLQLQPTEWWGRDRHPRIRDFGHGFPVTDIGYPERRSGRR
jgi:hypothetical protein